MAGQGDYGACGTWDCTVALWVWRRVVAAPGVWLSNRSYTARSTTQLCAAMVFSYHRILRLSNAAGFNRRMRKTARPVVWEGDGAQSPSLDPIQGTRPTIFCGPSRRQRLNPVNLRGNWIRFVFVSKVAGVG